MISVTEAIKRIEDNVQSLPAAIFALEDAAGKILAEDIVAGMDIPAFRQSSMDGYAFSFAGWKKHGRLKITGESAAGNNQEMNLAGSDAVRIFTGAPVPYGADTVVMQEKVKRENDYLIIEDDKLEAGLNVRPKGGEIKKGMMALCKNSQLSPAAIGFLAGIGSRSVSAYPMPSVSIIITGNELQEPGTPLLFGQVYESNSFALQSAIRQTGVTEIKIYRAADNATDVINRLNQSLSSSDLILLTGGVSVGDYDFVLEAVTACGVQSLFHKVKQRPGKPLFFGKKENKIVFGLPGNPSSVLTCFYQYVLPAISLMSNKKVRMKTIKVPLENRIEKNTKLTHFLKGLYTGDKVTCLDGQESYRMSSFAVANCLIKIDEETSLINAGDLVEIHLLPT